jgi:CheY-like chemotaxis protein
MHFNQKRLEKTTAKTTRQAKIQILCVDGYRESRDVISLVLEQHGYSVTTAHTPEDAARLAQSRQFDLYIVDSWPPDGAEYDLCRRIRTFDARTPLLFYSATDQEPGMHKAVAAGAQAHLRKPAYPQRLVQTVTALLDCAENGDRAGG